MTALCLKNPFLAAPARLFFVLLGVLAAACGSEPPPQAVPPPPKAPRPSIQSDSSKVVVRRLTPTKEGLYTLRVRVGDRTFSPVIDTGSSDLLVPGQDCDGCTGSVRYIPSGSAAQNDKGVEGEIIYGTGRARVRQTRDRVGLPDTRTSFAMDFHVIQESKALPRGGLLGLAYGSLLDAITDNENARAAFEPFVDGFSRHAGLSKRFTLLLCEQAGGTSRIILGDEGATGKIRRKDFEVWVPVPYKTYYTFPIESMRLAGARLGAFPDWRDSDGARDVVILDSGANGILLPSSVASELKRQLQRIVRAQNIRLPEQFWESNCRSNQVLQIRGRDFDSIRLPDVEIELVGGSFANATALGQAFSSARAGGRSFSPGPDNTVVLKVPARAFFLKSNGYYHYAVCPTEGEKKISILGKPFLDHFVTVFDRQRHIVGLAPSSSLCRAW